MCAGGMLSDGHLDVPLCRCVCGWERDNAFTCGMVNVPSARVGKKTRAFKSVKRMRRAVAGVGKPRLRKGRQIVGMCLKGKQSIMNVWVEGERGGGGKEQAVSSGKTSSNGRKADCSYVFNGKKKFACNRT